MNLIKVINIFVVNDKDCVIDFKISIKFRGIKV